MTDTFRVGLIGTGRIGLVHAGSIADTKGAELTYIADPFVDGAHKLAAQFGGKVTDDPLELLNSGEVDVVVIASPTPTHVDLINASIDAGVHAMCEKPIDLDIARADAIRDKVAAAKTHVALGFNRRFDPQFAEIHARVAAGEIGSLEQLTIISRDPGEPPAAYIAVSGGIFRDMTIHDFDMARFFLPNIVEVSAVGSNSFSSDIKDADDFDSAVVTMRGEGGELVTIINSRRAVYGYDQRLEAFGSNGALFAKNVAATTVERYGADEVEGRHPYIVNFLDRYATAYRSELQVFLEGIRNGSVANPNFEDGRKALILANAAQESAETGKVVDVRAALA